MAALAAQSVGQSLAAVTFASAAGGGDTAPTGDNVLLVVKNGDASSKTVTLTTTQTVAGLAVADVAVVVTAGSQAVIPLTPKRLYADANGRVAIAYSAVTSVTVGVLAL